MANCAVMLEWGSLVDGRESKALEEFMTSVAWWGELQKSGKISEFEIFAPSTGAISDRIGFAILKGSEQQIAALHASEEFKTRLARASLLVRNIRVNVLDTGDAIQGRMQRSGKAIKEVV
jgi:hypothetical protein